MRDGCGSLNAQIADVSDARRRLQRTASLALRARREAFTDGHLIATSHGLDLRSSLNRTYRSCLEPARQRLASQIGKS